MAKAVGVLLETAPATETGELVSVVDAWAVIEKAVPREKLAEALAVIAEAVPDAEWRVTRYGTVRGFIPPPGRCHRIRRRRGPTPVVKALRQLPHLIHRKKLPAVEVAQDLVTGSWRRLVFAAPGIGPELADKAAYSVAACTRAPGTSGAMPRAKLLSGDRWQNAQPTVLTALGLDAEPVPRWSGDPGRDALKGVAHRNHEENGGDLASGGGAGPGRGAVIFVGLVADGPESGLRQAF